MTCLDLPWRVGGGWRVGRDRRGRLGHRRGHGSSIVIASECHIISRHITPQGLEASRVMPCHAMMCHVERPAPQGLDGKQRWEHSEERRAWRHPRMAQGHVQRRHWYWQRFERPGSPERLTIEHAARAINDRFDCPRALLSSQPRSKFDCYVTTAPGSCVV